jgi:hypothetical protein
VVQIRPDQQYRTGLRSASRLEVAGRQYVFSSLPAPASTSIRNQETAIRACTHHALHFSGTTHVEHDVACGPGKSSGNGLSSQGGYSTPSSTAIIAWHWVSNYIHVFGTGDSMADSQPGRGCGNGTVYGGDTWLVTQHTVYCTSAVRDGFGRFRGSRDGLSVPLRRWRSRARTGAAIEGLVTLLNPTF